MSGFDNCEHRFCHYETLQLPSKTNSFKEEVLNSKDYRIISQCVFCGFVDDNLKIKPHQHSYMKMRPVGQFMGYNVLRCSEINCSHYLRISK